MRRPRDVKVTHIKVEYRESHKYKHYKIVLNKKYECGNHKNCIFLVSFCNSKQHLPPQRMVSVDYVDDQYIAECRQDDQWYVTRN